MTLSATLQAADLAEIASIAARIATKPGAKAIPILTCARLEMVRDTIRATATDLNHSVAAAARAKGQGSAVCDAHLLAATSKALDGKADVTLSMRGQVLVMQQGGARFELPCLPVADFPPTKPDDVERVDFKVDAKALAGAIKALNGALDPSDPRPYMTGVHFDASGSEPVLVGTDSKVVGVIPIKIKSEKKPPSVIIPAQALASICSVASLTDELSAFASRSCFGVSTGDTGYYTKVIDGIFPDWTRLFRKKSPTTLIVETKDLARAVSRILAADMRYARAEIGETVVIKGDHRGGDLRQSGAQDEFTASAFEGKPLSVSFVTDNLRWLIDSCAGAEALELSFESADDNVIIRVPGRPAIDARLIVPIRASVERAAA